MRKNISKRIWEILACPHCGSVLSRIDNGAKCANCHEEYGYSNEGQLDLRLRRKKSSQLQFELGTNLLPEKGLEFEVLQKDTFPQVDFTNIKVPHHMTEELMSYCPKARGDDSIMLDLGCGSAVNRNVCEHAGFEYVGLDYSSLGALILGDAQALPFKDSSFEFIISVAVIEHIRYPFVMMKEVYRVLKPGGKFIGSVAFLQGFHADSFYHHTHLGIFNLLHFTGLDIEYIAPNANRTALVAQTKILFPKLPHSISECLVMPIHLLHKIWWKFGYFITRSSKASEKNRILSTTDSFFFIANKELG